MMPPYELVRAHFDLPFELYPSFQVPAVNNLAPLPKSALYWEPGLGKTAGSTHCSLYKMIMGEVEVTLMILPPILINLWAKWLAKIKHKDGRPLRVLVYRGSPAERKKMSLQDADFILMSIVIFKKDFHRIDHDFGKKRVHVAVDEAHCIKDVGTDNYKKLRDFTADKSLQLLTGTPLNKPDDAYAYTKLISGVYRNLNQFMQIHAAEKDFFGNVTKWENLDLLQQNLLINADRKTKDDVLIDLPECIITQIDYDLDPRHLKLYRKLADEQLLKLPDGDKIDATQSSALRHALGQIVMQWHYFAQDESLKSAGYDLVEEVLDELGDKKLIVFGNYKRTNQELVRRFKCPGIWGEIPPKQKQAALDKFIDDPKCRMIVLHPVAAGQGLDGMQHICQDVLYVEAPVAVSHLTQSLSRVHRDGQRNVVTVRLGVAAGTIQNHDVRSLTAKEALVNPLQLSKARLRDIIMGGH